MPDESGWRGKDALNEGELAKQFWEAVSEPAKPEDLKVGDVVKLEVTEDGKVAYHRTIRITHHLTSATGEPQVQFEYVDEDPTSDAVLVVPKP